MSAFVVCVTGGIGCGKSAVAGMFARQGIVEVDTDRIAHELTGPGGAAIPALVEIFGSEILDRQGALDRAGMRRRAFAEPEYRRKLEGILHPLIRLRAEAACLEAQSPYVLLLIPLLVESIKAGSYRHNCRRVLAIDCDEGLQVARVMARSGLSEAEVRAIVATQASRQERLDIADDVISNDGTMAELEAKVGVLHQQYLMLARNS